MYSRDAELLFPPQIIPLLKGLRGELWNNLVDQVGNNEGTAINCLTFVLLMVHLNGCMSCSADSYKAMRGCTHCASQSIQRFPGSDIELMQLFEESRLDIEDYLKNNGKY